MSIETDPNLTTLLVNQIHASSDCASTRLARRQLSTIPSSGFVTHFRLLSLLPPLASSRCRFRLQRTSTRPPRWFQMPRLLLSLLRSPTLLLPSPCLRRPLIVFARVQGILDRETFVSSAGRRAVFSKLEWSRRGKASSHQSEAKLRADGTAKAHGEPILMPGANWMGLLDPFRAKNGRDIHDKHVAVPVGRRDFRSKTGRRTIVRRDVRAWYQLRRRRAQPEPSRQMGLHLAAKLTVQTRRRLLSSAPTTS